MEEAPKKRGRPAWHPTDEQRAAVEILAAEGMTIEQISRILGLGGQKRALLRECKDELGAGREVIHGRLKLSIWQQALLPVKEAVPLKIFLAKTQLGWRETQHVEHSGTVDIRTLSDEQLDALIARLKLREGDGSE